MSNRRDQEYGRHGGDDWRSDNQRSGWGPNGGEARFGGDHPPHAQVSHQGKGPKGFKRTDERIKELVSEALSDHHGIDASELEVDVEDGEVTLSGTVLDRSLKRLAEDIVERVSGVVDVHNTIRVLKTTGTDQGLGHNLPTDARQNMAAPRSQH